MEKGIIESLSGDIHEILNNVETLTSIENELKKIAKHMEQQSILMGQLLEKLTSQK